MALAEPGGEGECHLGTVRLRDHHTNEIILIPKPSDDPSDPLNWPQWYKYFIASLASWASLIGPFGATGPGVLLTDMAHSFFGPSGPDFASAIAKSAYFLTVCTLVTGLSTLVWVPLMVKFGRRSGAIGAYTVYAAGAAWCACAQSYGSMLAGRAMMGFATGIAEVLGPLVIADIFFVHERGTVMAIYACMLSSGAGAGSVLAGLITIHESWRAMFWLSCALTVFTALLMFFVLPETTYIRGAGSTSPTVASSSDEGKTTPENGGCVEILEHPALQRRTATPPSVLKIITTFPTRSYTSEPFWKLVLRPIALIILPSALWASLVMAVSIGFLVAMMSNVSSAFTAVYGFSTWQIGLCMLSILIGGGVALWMGGSLSDIVADRLTRRNGGIREPEMRLPVMGLSLITGPLALVLYGVGVGNRLHWMCPVTGLALITFTIVQAGNICVVYMIDCYRPIAGEVTVTQYAFKSLFGFLLSFYTNPWISGSGYTRAFGEMASISGAVFLCMFVFYFWGKTLRRRSWDWALVRLFIHWKEDREVGE
ncbi:major facilitator superfamily domain-containing protein [Aspergillus floccosus]